MSDWDERPTSHAELTVVIEPISVAELEPTRRAKLKILLGPPIESPVFSRLPVHPFRWEPAPDWKRDPVPTASGDAVRTALTAFYLAAERAEEPDEAAYDVDQGLRRFSAWLDDRTEP